jgi:hypothetical protein
MKDSETGPTGKIVRKVFNLETGTNINILFGIAQYDPDNLRRLWLLVQYQHYRTETTFSDAVNSLKDTFRRSNRVTGTYWSPPRRDQVLGRRQEHKIREFIEFWDAELQAGGIDIFNYALSANPNELIFGADQKQLPGIMGAQVKIRSEEWEEILTAVNQQRATSITISLPYELDRRLTAPKNQDTNYDPEEIPF